jgi:hypothetical protein
MKRGRIIAVIPSRKGSKGLPGKNVRPLCGKPLLAYTVEQAVAAGCFDRVIVSTDCEEISAIAVQFGAEVPFLRPQELAGDRSDLRSALNNLLDQLEEKESYYPDVMAVMFPTYPFRTLELIQSVVGAAREKAIKVQCSYPSGVNPRLLVAPGEGGAWEMRGALEGDIVSPAAHRSRRLLALMGNLSAEVVLPRGIRYGEENAAERLAYFKRKVSEGDRRFENWWLSIAVDDPILQIDINHEEDFLLAEKVLERGLFNFEPTKELVVQH